MLRDDGFTEQKPLYVVKPIRNYLYVAIRDLNPKRAANVKKNSPVDCFLMSRCADGYCCKATVVKQGGLPQARCVPSPRPKNQFRPSGWGWIFNFCGI